MLSVTIERPSERAKTAMELELLEFWRSPLRIAFRVFFTPRVRMHLFLGLVSISANFYSKFTLCRYA